MRAGRIAIPDTAFSIERTRQKRPRVENKDHLGFIRSLPCVICGTQFGIQAAHIRARSPPGHRCRFGNVSILPSLRRALAVSSGEILTSPQTGIVRHGND